MYDFDTLPDRNGFGACKWDRRTVEEKRNSIIPMSVADMEFECAPCVREMVERSARMGIYGYTDPEDRYFAAVKRWMSLRHGWQVERSEISCLYGVVPALAACIRAYTNEGDGVVIQTPVYYPFRDMIESNRRVCVEAPLIRSVDGKYSMDFDAFEKACSRENTKLFLMCSPHNPVGRVWTRAELEKVSKICKAHSVLVISDEIHFDIILRGSHTPYAKIDPDCVVLTAPSKTFNVPGLQLANLITENPELKQKLDAQIHSDGYSNVNFFGWAATIGAYEKGEEWLDALLDYLRGNRRTFEEFFRAELPEVILTPQEGTYLAWADFRALGLDYKQLEQLTRGKAQLVLDEGYIFGDATRGFERFNIALPRKELIKALDRLKSAVKEL